MTGRCIIMRLFVELPGANLAKDLSSECKALYWNGVTPDQGHRIRVLDPLTHVSLVTRRVRLEQQSTAYSYV
jgi:hypothetical protein